MAFVRVEKKQEKAKIMSLIEKIMYHCGYKVIDNKIILKAISRNECYEINDESIEIVLNDIKAFPIFGMRKEQADLIFEDLKRFIINHGKE